MQGRRLGAATVHSTGTALGSELAATLPLAARRDDVDDRPGGIAPPAVHDGRRPQCRCRADQHTMPMALHQVRKRYLPRIAEIIRSAQKIIVARFPYFIISPGRNLHAASDAAPMVHIVRFIAFNGASAIHTCWSFYRSIVFSNLVWMLPFAFTTACKAPGISLSSVSTQYPALRTCFRVRT